MTGAIVRLDEVDSTQRHAKALVGQVAHGTCVVARRQTAGRGRLGRTWVEPREGLYLSMVLYPALPAAQAARLTFGAAAGVLGALTSLGVVDARVKWPNDLVVPAPSESAPPSRIGPYKKVAGVIVEVAKMGAGGVLEACVLGIGVNVRAPEAGWPDDIRATAGALAEDAGFSGALEDVLQAVTASVPPALSSSVADFAGTLALLRAKSATLGRRVEVDGVVGVADAIDGEGCLVVVDDGGARHTVRAGDVWIANG